MARAKTLGALIDEVWAEREVKRGLEAQVNDQAAKIAGLEAVIMERLEKEGLDKATGTKAGISVTSGVTANVTDWDAFWAFIIKGKGKYNHLLQRRVSDPSYRELLEHKITVPGTESFVKKRLNIRSL